MVKPEHRLYTYEGHDIQCDRDEDGWITVTIFPHNDNARKVAEIACPPNTMWRRAWGHGVRLVNERLGRVMAEEKD